MYETDELIDEIRRLEKATDNVYIVMVTGTNGDGEPGTMIGPVYSYFPEWEELVEDIKEYSAKWAEYDYYTDNWYENHSWDCELADHGEGDECESDDCSDCCDYWKDNPERCKPMSREAFATENTRLKFTSYAQAYHERASDRVYADPSTPIYQYLGQFEDDYSEWTGEVSIRSAKVKKLPKGG